MKRLLTAVLLTMSLTGCFGKMVHNACLREGHTLNSSAFTACKTRRFAAISSGLSATTESIKEGSKKVSAAQDAGHKAQVEMMEKRYEEARIKREKREAAEKKLNSEKAVKAKEEKQAAEDEANKEWAEEGMGVEGDEGGEGEE